ncbi:hypothetical protein EfmAA242_35470 (plasmid) [Enterococcus faecium]|nr:hypothetical protein EfmAA242_35470 [Enterococcus faecium]
MTFRRGGNCKGLDVLALDEDDLYDFIVLTDYEEVTTNEKL